MDRSLLWQELHGDYMFELVTGEQEPTHTIQKVRTFTPPSSNRALVYAQLAKNLENACNALQHITRVIGPNLAKRQNVANETRRVPQQG